MPKGFRLAVSEDQVKAVVTQVRDSGLKARGILRLNLEILDGLKEWTIQRIIGKENLVDPVRSERFRKAKRVGKTKKRKLISFLRGGGKNLPDFEVARIKGVSENSVAWYRRTRVRNILGCRRFTEGTENERRKKISAYYVKKRKERYDILCALQKDPLYGGRDAGVCPCSICGMSWFKTEVFFYRSSNKNKAGQGTFIWTCKTCMAELSALERMGKAPEEARRIVKESVWEPVVVANPSISSVDLWRLQSADTCKGLLVKCKACGKERPGNKKYFHAINGKGSGPKLVNFCLACPVMGRKRNFFSKYTLSRK